MKALRIFRAACVLGIVVILSGAVIVALLDIGTDASAQPIEQVTPVVSTPQKLGQAAVGLSGPIGAGIEGTTAQGEVPSLWPDLHIGMPGISGPIGAPLILGGVLVLALILRR